MEQLLSIDGLMDSSIQTIKYKSGQKLDVMRFIYSTYVVQPEAAVCRCSTK